MKVDVREKDTIPVLDIKGEVTMYDIEPINEVIAVLISEKKYKIVFNLKEVPFIDSSGVGVILRTLSNLYKHGGIIHLYNCGSAVENVIKISIKNTSSQIFLNEDDAIKACLAH
jgi:anti-anti-sigma factor